MNKSCKNCTTQFEITDQDLGFYDKISPVFDGKKFPIPTPELCSDCRQQRRIAFRNESNLYGRQCDLCHKNIISIYSSDKLYTVYCHECWWSDKWDPLKYGRDFNFTKPFFEQFHELKKTVPQLALHVTNNENSDYVNLSGYNKNCYLISAAEYNENCLYGTQIINSKDCVDTLNCLDSQYCYDVLDCEKCYELYFSYNCKSCNSSLFLYDCRGCSGCIFSANLRNKQFHIFNQKYSKEEFLKRRQEIFNQINSGKLEELKKSYKELIKKSIHKNLNLINCENSFGNFLSDCKNAQNCFDLAHAQDCKYVFTGYNVKDLMDIAHATEVELSYESTSVGYKSYNILFGMGAWSTNESLYFDNCHNSSNLFGCVGLKKQKYCIFNKKYSSDEYQKLAAKIIEHMGRNNEFGEFFPIKISPFCYNETNAQAYYPLTFEQAIKRGYKWKEQDTKDYLAQNYKVPLNIKDVPENMIKETLSCTAFDQLNQKTCGRNYKIVNQELNFYRKANLPIPLKCPNCRHKDRFTMRPPRQLFTGICSKCEQQIQTSYTPNSHEKIFCEKCYLEKVV